MSAPSITVVAGQPFDLPIQCNLRGAGNVPAIYNSTDILTSSIVQSRTTTAVVTPTIGWLTSINGQSQTGYGQGQTQAIGTATQAASLNPTTSYTLCIWRALASAPTNPELIARVPLNVESLAV